MYLVAEFISTKKVHTFSFIRSLKCCNSATKYICIHIYIYIYVCVCVYVYVYVYMCMHVCNVYKTDHTHKCKANVYSICTSDSLPLTLPEETEPLLSHKWPQSHSETNPHTSVIE